jgi:chromosome partitioning protein
VNIVHSQSIVHNLKMTQDLVGIQEIAEMAGVTRAAVANWRTRFKKFPAPVVELASGPVFQRSDVRRWLKKRKNKMATIISTINLKGGVGKSTTTVAMAEFLSAELGQKVLVIDLDPQTNASVMLIGDAKWDELNKKGATLAQLFKDALLEDPSKATFDLDEALVRRASNVDAVRTVDLLASSIDLIDVQDRLATMPTGQFFANNPTEVLRRATKPIIDNYDYVLIDCPPNLGLITLNGLRISDGYIIPTIPDVLSTYGIPQIVTRVAKFAKTISETIEPLGIVVSKYREQSTVHRNTLARLRSVADPRVFETVIKENDQIAGSAEFKDVSTLRQKYGYQGQYNSYLALANELVAAVALA